MVNISLDTAQSVFPGICLTRYNSMQYSIYLPGLDLLIDTTQARLVIIGEE